MVNHSVNINKMNNHLSFQECVCALGLSHNVVSSTPRLSGIRTHNVSGDRHLLWHLNLLEIYMKIICAIQSWCLTPFSKNISVISWWSVLLMPNIGVPEKFLLFLNQCRFLLFVYTCIVVWFIGVWITLTGVTQPHYCACLKSLCRVLSICIILYQQNEQPSLVWSHWIQKEHHDWIAQIMCMFDIYNTFR
jgi:hypothetical protein